MFFIIYISKITSSIIFFSTKIVIAPIRGVKVCKIIIARLLVTMVTNVQMYSIRWMSTLASDAFGSKLLTSRI